MPDRILPYIESLPLTAKVLATAVVGGGAFIADALSEVKGWEDVTLKACFGVAIIFLVRLLLKERAEYKADMKELMAQHKVEFQMRDAAMQDTMKKNTEAVQKVAELTEKQTGYFEAVTRNIVNERFKSPPSNIP